MKDHTSNYRLPTIVPNRLTNPTVSLQENPAHGFPILQPRTEIRCAKPPMHTINSTWKHSGF